MATHPTLGFTLVAALVLSGCGSEGSGTPDASVDGPASSNAFHCGSLTCDPAAQYCYSIAAGLAAAAMPGCNELPSACAMAPTCDCITPLVTDCAGGLGCQQEGNRFTVVCSLP